MRAFRAAYFASSVASNARASRMPTLSPSGCRNAIAFSMCFRASSRWLPLDEKLRELELDQETEALLVWRQILAKVGEGVPRDQRSLSRAADHEAGIPDHHADRTLGFSGRDSGVHTASLMPINNSPTKPSSADRSLIDINWSMPRVGSPSPMRNMPSLNRCTRVNKVFCSPVCDCLNLRTSFSGDLSRLLPRR